MQLTFHDRFLILGSHTEYYIVASIKDASNKCVLITFLEDDTPMTEPIQGSDIE